MLARRILIIEDEDDIREVAQLTLEAVGGWQVSTPASASEGLTKAEVEQPDAILLDIMMPNMDGLATFQQLRTNPATWHIPVIVLTAKLTNLKRFAQIGVAAMLAKPFNPMSLARQVATALGWS
ncbi:MAG: response regulator [Mojavia pulchra JT2-VF2]|uniref:Response regulator n=1 Tax=Mojavia pulchra JT2-VF2 TaxID=287848 RepID=A0A951Q3D1_9NOST|nr:response regulator [Mojavia pulchra JT2-VF2]